MRCNGNNAVYKPGQQAIYGLPSTSSSGGQRPCPCLCLKGVQLITAEQKSYAARLRDMITVVSQFSQSQNTNLSQRTKDTVQLVKLSPALPVYLLPLTFTLPWLRVVLVLLLWLHKQIQRMSSVPEIYAIVSSHILCLSRRYIC